MRTRDSFCGYIKNAYSLHPYRENCQSMKLNFVCNNKEKSDKLQQYRIIKKRKFGTWYIEIVGLNDVKRK